MLPAGGGAKASVQVSWLQNLRFGGDIDKDCNPRMWEAGGLP